MKVLRDKMRGPRALPAILLAALMGIFVAVQTEQVGHLHGADDPVGDCSQFHHYGGHAVVASTPEMPALVVVGGDSLQPLQHSPVSIRYRLQARGPPAAS